MQEQTLYKVGLVDKVKILNSKYYLLQISMPAKEIIPKIPSPGQFFQIKPLTVGLKYPYSGSLLFKPFSVYDFDKGQLTLMIKNIGKATKQLVNLVKGDRIALIGALGKPFDLPYRKQVLLVSGGVGYAPLYYLKRKLLDNQNQVIWLHGGQSCDDVFDSDIICTDDGSLGNKGFVTCSLYDLLSNNCAYDNLKLYKDLNFESIFCCGPRIMMKKVFEISWQYSIPAQFSLEEYMACGIGVCCGCAVKINPQGVADPLKDNHYLLVCKDGPVFKGEEIDWNE